MVRLRFYILVTAVQNDLFAFVRLNLKIDLFYWIDFFIYRKVLMVQK